MILCAVQVCYFFFLDVSVSSTLQEGKHSRVVLHNRMLLRDGLDTYFDLLLLLLCPWRAARGRRAMFYGFTNRAFGSPFLIARGIVSIHPTAVCMHRLGSCPDVTRAQLSPNPNPDTARGQWFWRRLGYSRHPEHELIDITKLRLGSSDLST